MNHSPQRIGIVLIALLGACLDTVGVDPPHAMSTGEASEPPPEATSGSSGPPPPATTTTTDPATSTSSDTSTTTTPETTGDPTTGAPVTCIESEWSPHVVSFEQHDPMGSTAYLMSGLAIDAHGDYVIAGTSSYPATHNVFVLKLTFDGPTGTLAWPPRSFEKDGYSSYASVEAMAMDESGDIILAGSFQNPIDPCNDQPNPTLCPPDLTDWNSNVGYDSFIVKLDGDTTDALWGGHYDAGGTDGALSVAVKDHEVAVSGHCNDHADVLAMTLDADGGLRSSACFPSSPSLVSGWATAWLPGGPAIAGTFTDSLALGDPPLTAGDTLASGFFAALDPRDLTPQAEPRQFGVSGHNLVHSMAVLPDGRVALGGACSGNWTVAGQTCGSDRTPFVLTMSPDGEDLQRTVLRADQLGYILDIHPTADGERLLVGGVLAPTDPSFDIVTYVLETGYAALLQTDTLTKVQEWTLQGAPSQVRSVTVDATGGLVFGGTLGRPTADPIEWKGPHTVEVPPGERDYNLFVIRECMPE